MIYLDIQVNYSINKFAKLNMIYYIQFLTSTLHIKATNYLIFNAVAPVPTHNDVIPQGFKQWNGIRRVPLLWASVNSAVIQWQSSVPEFEAQRTLECHWGNIFWLPVRFQRASSGFPVAFLPVVFQCVPIMQINTGSPLGHHWDLALADVVAVASQCTCGSSGLPVWSVQWYPSVLTISLLEVTGSGHYPAACNHLCIQLVWWELFELNWSHLNCHPQYTKKI